MFFGTGDLKSWACPRVLCIKCNLAKQLLHSGQRDLIQSLFADYPIKQKIKTTKKNNIWIRSLTEHCLLLY